MLYDILSGLVNQIILNNCDFGHPLKYIIRLRSGDTGHKAESLVRAVFVHGHAEDEAIINCTCSTDVVDLMAKHNTSPLNFSVLTYPDPVIRLEAEIWSVVIHAWYRISVIENNFRLHYRFSKPRVVETP